MKYKKRIYILIISVIVYFIVGYIYNSKVLRGETKDLYVISKQLSRGDIITFETLEKIKIEKDKISQKYIKEYVTYEEIGNIVAKDTYFVGQILSKDMCIEKGEYHINQLGKELISINISDTDDNVSNQINVGNIINLYYTGKITQIGSVLNNLNNISIVNDAKSDGYSTFLILEDIKVAGTFDSNGNSINKNYNTKTTNNIKIDTITIETTKEISLIINNIKNNGRFSASIIK